MATGRTSAQFTAALRNREQLIGYWSLLDSPIAAERLARVGYDYLAFDAQHGLFGYQGMLNNLLATDTKGSTAVGMVRVEANDLTYIGKALDAGASAVIVPLVDNARDAADAVAAVRYPPLGRRSYGPMRAQLRIGPNPADTHEQTAVLAMIETADGLADVEEICATPGLDGIYVGPSDLRLAIGGATSTDPSVQDDFEQALTRVRKAAEAAGIAAGIHNADGASAARRLAEGFTFASVAADVVHLQQIATSHLEAARGGAR
ncbi:MULTISPECIES: HpcH/HpaI aldolase family protein [unclassified Streptomyces]|uniref:HpcH/HpaI aldolase family protein n=1 Tax=unclassified Streptomyces TaxID=2593676 RepID=UPI002DD86D06|nr:MULTISPECIES: aldolase/citrate lyase family protein [unclassified Streptomyces]WSF84790.1 aldolase/citrate lyase family protein [Streptomyces sp. NBC_01744]WSC38919.1 aldolase/citrate lyase family protein [Streptomyces sp. NBC_01763]WSC47061.1 aldolase/citrate lyase family protein [Streptomyces sp. NBC_01762]WSD26715.1 aldolase/citrate lyase family protein [Streptomyces sp. NBC_01751]WSJ51358.1 aldolase/citrate lyase family protein [Streptomyces sp. NBC_01318]